MGENRKVLCIDILTYMSVITGFDVNTLTDDEIILMLENLQTLSDNNLLLLHKDLNIIFEESCITGE
nr:MAG TPA: hypothetical protein [Caudoviricetes sp.]DAM70256.1 MAG TPA: hypothetical protein [Caudoviricetes sp.]